MTEGRKLFAAHAFIPSDENCGHAKHITNKNYQRSAKLTTARVTKDFSSAIQRMRQVYPTPWLVRQSFEVWFPVAPVNSSRLHT